MFENISILCNVVKNVTFNDIFQSMAKVEVEVTNLAARAGKGILCPDPLAAYGEVYLTLMHCFCLSLAKYTYHLQFIVCFIVLLLINGKLTSCSPIFTLFMTFCKFRREMFVLKIGAWHKAIQIISVSWEQVDLATLFTI